MLTLHNVHTIEEGVKDISLKDGKIVNIFSPGEGNANNSERHLYFDQALVFPGMINSHDHLDFNLFPRLGNRIYKNYLEWGDDIHKRNKPVIDAVLKIPQTIRTQLGMYKNLFNGITTVFNHGEQLQIQDPVIDVLQDRNSLHSVRLEKSWFRKLNNPFITKDPYVVHVGEGT